MIYNWFQFHRTVAMFCAIFLISMQYSIGQSDIKFDVVLKGGRVIDPETKLDAIRNIGIKDGRITEISTSLLKGQEIIDVSGLVVAPGFIDMHVHGRSNKEQEYQVHDGITTALELEWGIEFLKPWYETRKSKALINYGASVCWPFERFRAINKYNDGVQTLYQKTLNGESSLENLFDIIGPSYNENLGPEEMNKMLSNIQSSLNEGGIGIGVPIGYLPKTDPNEMFQVYRLAARLNSLVFSHVRGPNIMSVQEALADAMITGASLHIVHINSMSLGQIRLALNMVDSAFKKGFDITAEIYPYTAGSTLINTAVFDNGWQEKLGMDYKDIQWVATGERLTERSFNHYRKIGGSVILHMMKPEWIRAGIANPNTIIASDGMPYAPLAHPRTAGTFARVLGKYVRVEKVIDLNTAIEKMTLLPAKRLEGISSAMHSKGRIQVGADADITIFDSDQIIDKSTFEKGLEFSKGIEFVLVNGVIVVKNGITVDNVFPGKPVYGIHKR